MSFTVSAAPHIRPQTTTGRIMASVLVALSPVMFWAVVQFGWAAAVHLAVCGASAVVFELLSQIVTRRRVTAGDLSALVTGVILALNLPPAAPWWIGVVGSGFAVLLVKQLFGGLGRNFLNPALTARAALLASWPVIMTSYTLPSVFNIGALPVADALSGATPLNGLQVNLYELFIGRIPGSMGEICKLAILLGAAYLLIRRVITWHVPVSFIGVFMLATYLGGGDPLRAVLSGGVLFGAVFMATDYVTNPMTKVGQLVFGAGCGLLVFLIRNFGSYPEGVTYAILIMNIFTPLIDRFIKPKVFGTVKKARTPKKVKLAKGGESA